MNTTEKITENTKKDEGLIGNEKIEEAIDALQQEAKNYWLTR